MKSYLVIEGLWDLIEREPPSNRNIEWVRRDEIARAKIGLLVEDSQIPFIVNAKTAKEAWVALRLQHEKFNSKLLAFRKMCQLRLLEGGSMEQHITAFTKYICQLSVLGVNLPDIVITGIIMSSLPNSNLDLILDVEKRMKEEGNIPYKKVFEMLLEGHKKLKVTPSKQYHNNLNGSLNGETGLEERMKAVASSPNSPRHLRNRC